MRLYAKTLHEKIIDALLQMYFAAKYICAEMYAKKLLCI